MVLSECFTVPGQTVGAIWLSLDCLSGSSDGKESACNAGHPGSIPGLRRSPGGRMAPTSVFLPEEPHRERRLAGYSLWGHKESGTIE